MDRVLVLDAQPLGLMCHPHHGADVREWVSQRRAAGHVLAIPEVVDYEVRRELLRLRKTNSILRLDEFKQQLYYVPIQTDQMLLAAEFWASARQQGRPGGPSDDLDADMMIAAQARLMEQRGDLVTVVTANPRHFELFVDARHWQDIK